MCAAAATSPISGAVGGAVDFSYSAAGARFRTDHREALNCSGSQFKLAFWAGDTRAELCLFPSLGGDFHSQAAIRGGQFVRLRRDGEEPFQVAAGGGIHRGAHGVAATIHKKCDETV